MTSGPVEGLIRYAFAGDGVDVSPAKMARIIRKSLDSFGSKQIAYRRTVQLIDAIRRGTISEQHMRVLNAVGVADPTGELAAQRVDFARVMR